MWYSKYVKRLIDLTIAITVFVLALPVFAVVAVLLYIANGGKVLFLQPRPGKDTRIFRVIKFKTMNDRTDSEGALLPDVERITALGRFIRKTSLDEIPQLLNVIKGDMSLVGPRPLLVEYLDKYNEEERQRHGVRPGITGWAQVNGRNAISWKEKFALDVWYVQHISWSLDLKILFLTLQKVLRASDVNASPNDTMEKFTGNHI